MVHALMTFLLLWYNSLWQKKKLDLLKGGGLLQLEHPPPYTLVAFPYIFACLQEQVPEPFPFRPLAALERLALVLAEQSQVYKYNIVQLPQQGLRMVLYTPRTIVTFWVRDYNSLYVVIECLLKWTGNTIASCGYSYEGNNI